MIRRCDQAHRCPAVPHPIGGGRAGAAGAHDEADRQRGESREASESHDASRTVSMLEDAIEWTAGSLQQTRTNFTSAIELAGSYTNVETSGDQVEPSDNREAPMIWPS